MLIQQNGSAAPSLLERNSIMEIVEYWTGVYLSRFPLLRLFPEKVIASERFMWEMVYELLVVGNFNSKPQPGQRLDFQRYSAALANVFYQSYKFTLDSSQALACRDPGKAQLIYGQDVSSEAARKITEALARHVAAYWRKLHVACASILSNDAPTISISNVNQTINFGITLETTASDWTNPASDVLTEFNTLVTDFARKNEGLKPNVFIRHPFFHRDVILGNDELRANFAPLMPSVANSSMSFLKLLMEEGPNGLPLQDIAVFDMIDPSGTGNFADMTDVWPQERLCLAYIDPSVEENLSLVTARTQDNDYQGGFSTWTEDKKDPARTEVGLAGNHIPIIKRPDRIMIVDFTP